MKFIIGVPGIMTREDADRIRDTVKDLHDLSHLIHPNNWDVRFITDEEAEELRETVDEIWVYKVKDTGTGEGT